MNSGTTVFAQLMEFVPPYEFRLFVDRYHGNYKVKSFSCWDQFLCLAFAQLTYRESLRDIEACLRAAGGKLYHMGIRGKVSRNTLAHANEVRDWRIYRDFAQVLIRNARELYLNDPLAVELDQTAYALDSTVIDLCLSLFPWAKFRKRKAAVKLHTLLDLRASIPTTVIVTAGTVHDVNIMDELFWEPGAVYVMDRGYVDFRRLYRMQQDSAFFVTRAKKNFRFQRLYSSRVNKSTGLRCESDRCASWVLCPKRLPRETATHSLLRFSNQQAFRFSHQQLHLTGSNHCRAVSVPLAGGVVLQMDQAAPADQGVLRHQRERGEDSSMDRYIHLCSCSHCQEKIEAGSKPLHDSTDFERDSFRENAHFAGAFCN